MKGFLKFIMSLAGLALIAIGAAALFFGSRGETYLKAQGEQRLSQAFDAPATINRVRIHLYEPVVVFEDVRLGNPQGFPEGEAVCFGRIRARYDMHSLGLQMPDLDYIQVEGVSIHVQSALDRGANVQRLLDNAERGKQEADVKADVVVAHQLRGEEAEVFSLNQPDTPFKAQAFTMSEVAFNAREIPQALAAMLIRTYTGQPAPASKPAVEEDKTATPAPASPMKSQPQELQPILGEGAPLE